MLAHSTSVHTYACPNFCEYQVPYVALTDVADIYIAKIYLLFVRVLDSSGWLPVRIPTKDATRCQKWRRVPGGSRFESQPRTPPAAINGPGFEPIHNIPGRSSEPRSLKLIAHTSVAL